MTNPFLADVAAPPIGQAAAWAKLYDGAHGPLIDLSQAVPGHAPPDALSARLASGAGSPDAARYGPILGDPALRDAYAAHVSDLYGASVSPNETAITAGCNQAFFATMMTIARTGDAILVPAPAYFNHTMTLGMLGIEARILPSSAKTGFLPSLADVERLGDDRVRAVVLVSPNNPTGAIYPPELLSGILSVCRKRSIRLVLDETYRDFLPPGEAPPHGLFEAADWRDRLVSLYSFSKSYAVPGHRIGAIVASESFLAEVAKVLDCIQICAPRPPQQALAWAIEATAPWRAEQAAAIAARAKVFRAALARFPDWRIEQMGAYFAYVRHPYPGVESAVVAETLAKRLGIVTLPGSFFGTGQDGHLRIAFANIATERISALGERLVLASDLFTADAAPSRLREAVR